METTQPDVAGPRGARTACGSCAIRGKTCTLKEGETACTRCSRYGLNECDAYFAMVQRLKDEKESKDKLINEVADLREEINTFLKNTPGAVSLSDAVIRLRNLHIESGSGGSTAPTESDLISEGVVSLEEAEDLFNMFTTCVNPLLWDGLLMQHETLDSARRSSAMLTAAILSVAALLSPDRADIYEKCHEVFVSLSLMRRLMNPHHNSLDDVRALCIGACYFKYLGEQLSGEAIRISSELSLDAAFHRYMRGEVADMEQVRLWCLAYICGQYFTTGRGCPPKDVGFKPIWDMTRIPSPEVASDEDQRLIALALYYDTLANAHATFYTDCRHPLNKDDMVTIRALEDVVKRCLQQYPTGTFHTDHPHSSFPQDLKNVFHAFAQFQLYSLAFRGIFPYDNSPTNFEAWTFEHCRTACAAIDAAIRVLSVIGTDSDLSLNLRYVPINIHQMVGFCASFLLRIVGLNMGLAGSATGDIFQLKLPIDSGRIVHIGMRVARCLLTKGADLNEEHTCNIVGTSLMNMLQMLSDLHWASTSEVPVHGWGQLLQYPMTDIDASIASYPDGTFGIGFNHLLPYWFERQEII
ncbi:C6 transcription factor [Aspergillus neoniger CBS 115656]|uniref:C6 transcription factor n=1 Tax=Aspergillus neoniger (strain CBS 115656) TaxID=1448310 RepID=A0A318YRH1_ASPNB|nr:C6 transcription factor [Aspergillus neoniger CBS 115656]PYH37295.1 C6 transcription factor [Aspergillus neoniger CBS 115656]